MTTGAHTSTEKASLIQPVRARHIMHAYKPRGWRIVMGGAQQPGASGLCSYSERTIYVPFVCDDYSLYVYLHEVGHARLHRRSAAPTHVVEYQAEMFAHKALRDCGFRVSRTLTQSARAYVREELIKDQIKGLPIDPKIKRWATRNHRRVAEH